MTTKTVQRIFFIKELFLMLLYCAHIRIFIFNIASQGEKPRTINYPKTHLPKIKPCVYMEK